LFVVPILLWLNTPVIQTVYAAQDEAKKAQDNAKDVQDETSNISSTDDVDIDKVAEGAEKTSTDILPTEEIPKKGLSKTVIAIGATAVAAGTALVLSGGSDGSSSSSITATCDDISGTWELSRTISCADGRSESFNIAFIIVAGVMPLSILRETPSNIPRSFMLVSETHL
jgi:hypothetical protein